MREYDNDYYHDVFYTQPERENKPAGLTKKRIALLLILCVTVSSLFGIGSAYITTSVMQKNIFTGFIESPYVIPMNMELSSATGSKLSVQQIIDVAAEAVVEISTESVTSDFWMRQIVRPGAGSGVILSPEGYIMTNNHVIRNTNKITVTLRDGTVYDAEVVGFDSQTDVAVIKIDARGLTPVIFGDSDGILLGDLAVAIGNPLGQLGGTATVGIISALDRQITIEGKSMTLLQTDAAINRGNSGGGLFNQYGELIGLVVAKSEGSGIEGLGFAIPANLAKTVAGQLIESGYVRGRPQIGIQMIDLTSAQDAMRYGVRTQGVYVGAVLSDGAKRAGFQEGDLLYFIEDTRIEKPSDLTDELMKYNVGDIITVTVVRDNEMLDLQVILSEQTQNR